MRELDNSICPEALAQLPTPELDEMLHAEVEKELPDAQLVRRILQILWEREADFPVEMNEKIEKAWDRYQKKTDPRRKFLSSPAIKAAAVVLIAGLLALTLPQSAVAERFFERLSAWTESFFDLFSTGEQSARSLEYEYRTDHPSLQELYDAVAELGVTVPVVPMWLEEEYVLDECKTYLSPTSAKIVASFSDGEREAVFEINIYYDDLPREFHKSKLEAISYENEGITHYIFHNKDVWTVVWTQENVDCSIVVECQEDVLYRILDSIYTMEE